MQGRKTKSHFNLLRWEKPQTFPENDGCYVKNDWAGPTRCHSTSQRMVGEGVRLPQVSKLFICHRHLRSRAVHEVSSLCGAPGGRKPIIPWLWLQRSSRLNRPESQKRGSGYVNLASAGRPLSVRDLLHVGFFQSTTALFLPPLRSCRCSSAFLGAAAFWIGCSFREGKPLVPRRSLSHLSFSSHSWKRRSIILAGCSRRPQLTGCSGLCLLPWWNKSVHNKFVGLTNYVSPPPPPLVACCKHVAI